MGHTIRCLWIAKALIDIGFTDVVVVSEASNPVGMFAKQYGIPYLPVPADCLPESESDAETLLSKYPGLVIIDSPHATSIWSEKIRNAGIPLILISGVSGPKLEADAYLWPESCPEYNVPDGKFVCGERYLPLAPPYWEGPVEKLLHQERRILVTFGGVDHYDLSSVTIRALNEVFEERCDIRIVIGSYYSNLDKIKIAAASSRHRIELIIEPVGLDIHLRWCDFAVSAGGTTLFEMCALGVPGIGVAVWALQEPVVANVVGAGAAQGIVYIDDEVAMYGKLRQALIRIANEPMLLKVQSIAGPKYIDGQGALRVAEWIKRFFG